MSRLTKFLRSVYSPPDDGRLLPLQQPGFPVAVCWSAKSGCTTVLKWFLAHNGLLDEALAYSDWIHHYREEKLFAAKGYAFQCERLFKRNHRHTLNIKVIRDPASRAVSSFLHLLRNERDANRWPDSVEVIRWKAAVGLAGQRGLSFQQFLMYVAAQQVNHRLIDPHFRPQYDARQDPGVDVLIRLEDLSAGLSAVEDRCGLPHVDVEQLSRSHHHNPANADHGWPSDPAAFPADLDCLHELGTPPVRDFLDAETRLLIRTAYWTDYEAYGHLYDVDPSATLQLAPDRAKTGVDYSGHVRRAA